jgi:hypothetical protein
MLSSDHSDEDRPASEPISNLSFSSIDMDPSDLATRSRKGRCGWLNFGFT